MYFRYDYSGRGWDGGHVVLGATAPRTTWYFAEGYTGQGFDMYLAILNPNGQPANVTITYYYAGGGTTTRSLSVGATSRQRIAVHDIGLGVGRGQAISTKVESTNGVGIVVERPMYFVYGPGNWTGGHIAMGADGPRQNWYFAEGTTRDGFDVFLTIQNPNGQTASITVTYFLAGGGTVTRTFSVAANSRTTVAVHEPTSGGNPGGLGRTYDMSTRVQSNLNIVVERPIYFNYLGQWTGGHVVLGAPGPNLAWYFAEGYTGTNFDEYLTIQNPNSSPSNILITYYQEPSGAVTRSFTVPANSRSTVTVHDPASPGNPGGLGRNQAISARVESTNNVPIIVERPMYFSYTGGGNIWPFTANGGHVALGYAL